MPKRISKLAKSLKQLGDIQVTEWDFMGLLNTDITKLEISRSLRRLGGIQVMEWDFKNALQAVKNTANQEVDIIDIVRRTAHYKVLEWEFRSVSPAGRKPSPPQPAQAVEPGLSREEMQKISLQLKNFLQYVVVNLIDEPASAQIKVTKLGPLGLRFKLVLAKRDVAMLIGREGFTASTIRSILKAAAGMHGVQALLQIQSHEAELELAAKDTPRGKP